MVRCGNVTGNITDRGVLCKFCETTMVFDRLTTLCAQALQLPSQQSPLHPVSHGWPVSVAVSRRCTSSCIAVDDMTIWSQCGVLSTVAGVEKAQAPRKGVITSARIMSTSSRLLVFIDIGSRIVVLPPLNQGHI